MGVNQNFLQLEATIRKNAQEDAKSGADQTEKPTGPGGDGKDALAGAGDPTMMAASVDALIAGFKSRSPPRRRPADKGVGLQHVLGTRSAMMTSLLPSPAEQKSVLLSKQRNKLEGRMWRQCNDNDAKLIGTTLRRKLDERPPNAKAVEESQATQ